MRAGSRKPTPVTTIPKNASASSRSSTHTLTYASFVITPLVLEIGSGMGEAVLAMMRGRARHRPADPRAAGQGQGDDERDEPQPISPSGSSIVPLPFSTRRPSAPSRAPRYAVYSAVLP